MVGTSCTTKAPAPPEGDSQCESRQTRCPVEFARAAVAWVLLGAAMPDHCAHAGELERATSLPSTTARRPFQIADLIGIRDVSGRNSGFLLSPDRTAVALQLMQMDVASNRYNIEWVVLPLPAGTTTGIGDGGDLITLVDDNTGRDNGSPAQPLAQWSPDNQWLAYLRKSDGDIQIWRSRRDGSDQQQLSRRDGDIHRFVWSSDGSKLLFTAKASRSAQRTAEQRVRDDGFLWDETFYPGYSRLPTWPRKGDGSVWTLDLSTNVTRTARAEETLTFSEMTEARQLAARPQAKVVVPFEDGRVASLEALDANLQGWRPPLTLVVSSLPEGHSPTVCPALECTGQIVSVRWHPTGDRLYFTRREGHGDGQRGIYEWRIGASKTRRILLTDDWILDDCEILPDRALCLHEGPIQPRRLVAISLADGSLTSLFDPNPEFKAIEFTKVEKLTWQDRYGNDTFGHLVYPAGYRKGERYPLVIVQYQSRGFLRGGVGGEYPIHVLAAHGFFVLSWERPVFRAIDARLSANESVKYTYAEKREHLSKQSALEVILDSLTARGLIDPARVGITGLSDGAETIDIGLIHSRRFAVAATSTIFDDPLGYYFLARRDRLMLKPLSGLPAPDDSEYSRTWWGYVSPSLNIRQIHAPILMHISESEQATAAQFVAALQDSAKPFEAYVYPGEFHIKNQPRHLLRSMERSVDWFNFWLREVEDPVPEKTQQYVRWRKLRELRDSSRDESVGPAS